MNEKLFELRKYAELLSEGIDPTSNIPFAEDTILNNKAIRKYNSEVMRILDKIILLEEGKTSVNNKRNNKIPFFLSEKSKASIDYSEEPISISALCYILNSNISKGMKKLHATQITKWLQEEGYLINEEWRDGKVIKVPTTKGNNIGISTIAKQNKFGNKYSVNLYDIDAQIFIVDNLEKIVFGQH